MIRFAAVAAAVLLAPPAAAQETPVDVELVLAVDMSGSMDAEEKLLQRDGYVAALRSPEFAAALADAGSVALAYLEWAGPSSQVVVVDWRLLADGADAAAFADALAGAPLSWIRGTSISGALDHAAEMIAANGYAGFRRVIDVSGDGANSRGRPVTAARDAALARGIVINGLPLTLRPSWIGDRLAGYYRDCVVGGPGHFTLPVRGAAQLADAIRRKLVLEVAGGPPPAAPTQTAAQPADCMVGERMRRMLDAP